jgi:hypothetical protein
MATPAAREGRGREPGLPLASQGSLRQATSKERHLTRALHQLKVLRC